MARMINLTREKGCSMMEFVLKASAAKRLSDAANIPLNEAREKVNAVIEKVGITVLDGSLPSETEIPAGMIPVIEIINGSNNSQLSFIDKDSIQQEVIDRKFSNNEKLFAI